MLNLRFSIGLLLIMLTGCHQGQYKSLIPTENVGERSLKPIFEDRFNSYLFKANIQVYTKKFSGLLVTKQTQLGTYRVIFTTEMGMKLFDFEINQKESIVHYSIPQFDKPLFMDTIKKDLQILLVNGLDKNAAEVFNDKSGLLVYKYPFDVGSTYYYQGENLSRIEHAERNKKKIVFTLNNYEDDFPQNISIQHYGFRLKIDLTNLQKS
ncbi:hypothetical protein [uncultured Arcticibacterium sp.]|uniref:hypothetical protein n=1 Tax=uncultured Arcticibacterium sp. TaxID=2173042 RepID=UPI0030F7B7FA